MEKSFDKYFYNFKELLNAYIKKIKKIPWALGRNAFLYILIFILMSILIGQFLFYKYILLVETEEPKIIHISDKFQENIYQSVLEKWQNRENFLRNSSLLDENYEDPFQIKLK